jgi:hypothetical protein
MQRPVRRVPAPAAAPAGARARQPAFRCMPWLESGALRAPPADPAAVAHAAPAFCPAPPRAAGTRSTSSLPASGLTSTSKRGEPRACWPRRPALLCRRARCCGGAPGHRGQQLPAGHLALQLRPRLAAACGPARRSNPRGRPRPPACLPACLCRRMRDDLQQLRDKSVELELKMDRVGGCLGAAWGLPGGCWGLPGGCWGLLGAAGSWGLGAAARGHNQACAPRRHQLAPAAAAQGGSSAAGMPELPRPSAADPLPPPPRRRSTSSKPRSSAPRTTWCAARGAPAAPQGPRCFLRPAGLYTHGAALATTPAGVLARPAHPPAAARCTPADQVCHRYHRNLLRHRLHHLAPREHGLKAGGGGGGRASAHAGASAGGGGSSSWWAVRGAGGPPPAAWLQTWRRRGRSALRRGASSCVPLPPRRPPARCTSVLHPRALASGGVYNSNATSNAEHSVYVANPVLIAFRGSGGRGAAARVLRVRGRRCCATTRVRLCAGWWGPFQQRHGQHVMAHPGAWLGLERRDLGEVVSELVGAGAGARWAWAAA